MIKDIQHISDLIAWLPTPMIESDPYSDFLISMQGQTMQRCIDILKRERNNDYSIYKSREDEIDNYIYCEKEQTGIKPFLFFEIIDLIIDFCQLNEWNELNDTVDFFKFLHKNRYFNKETFDTIQDDSKILIFAKWVSLNEQIRFGGVRACYPTDNEDEYRKMQNDDEYLKRVITYCNNILDDYKSNRELIAPEPVVPKELKPEPIDNKERITQIIDTLVANEYKSSKTFINIQLKKHFTDLLNKDLNSKPQQWNDTDWMLYVLIEKFIELELVTQINDIPEYILRHFTIPLKKSKKAIKDNYNRAKANRKFSDFTAKLNKATIKFQKNNDNLNDRLCNQ